MTITFVNRFTVQGTPQDFERAFRGTAEFLRRQPGLVGWTLSQQVDAPGSYVNVAVWESEQAFRAAVSHPDFRQHAAAVRRLASSESALYTERLSHTSKA